MARLVAQCDAYDNLSFSFLIAKVLVQAMVTVKANVKESKISHAWITEMNIAIYS